MGILRGIIEGILRGIPVGIFKGIPWGIPGGISKDNSRRSPRGEFPENKILGK